MVNLMKKQGLLMNESENSNLIVARSIKHKIKMKRVLFILPILMACLQLSGQIIINEICYDPSNTELLGDANNDGVYSQAEDEFIEFINTTAANLDVSGYKIFDSANFILDDPNHLIPDGTIIPPLGALVVFGGGTPTGTFGGAIVQTSTSGNMSLNNTGDIVYLVDAEGSTVLTFDIEPLSDNPNESYTRSPDITGDDASFVQHGNLIPDVLFSPGTTFDGMPFNTAFVVESIAVQGAEGATEITDNQGTLQMEAMIMPEFASDQSVTWSVENGSGSATIDENGLLSATGNGEVTVTATANDSSGVSGSAVITISGQTAVLVETIVVTGDGGATSITENGGGLQMSAEIFPVDAADQSVTWSIENGTGSGTIDENGFLEALTDGTVTVIATANDGSGIIGSLEITISNQGSSTAERYNVELSVYPNPAIDVLYLKSTEQVKRIEILTVDGRVIQNITVLQDPKIDISQLATGSYLVKAYFDGAEVTSRFLKQ